MRRARCVALVSLLLNSALRLASASDSVPKAERAFTPKNIPLCTDGSAYLSLGGELRERFEYLSEPLFGLRAAEQEAFLLHRLLLGADLHAGKYLRIFAQFGNHLELGKNGGRSPTDVDEFDAHQAFVDLTMFGDVDSKLMLRVGRQEMTFGSGRLVSVRGSANVRRTFDGARLSIAEGAATLDAFVVRSVELEVGAWNDNANQAEAFWGVYGVVPFGALPDGHADLYYLGLERDAAGFQQGVADEQRHTFGTRIWGAPMPWDYNSELTIQTGRFGIAKNLAWSAAAEVGYTFKLLRFSPRVGLKADIASGDSDPYDERLATFNPLFPKQTYFSELTLIAPSNIIDVHPSIAAKLAENVSLTVDWNFIWKHRSEDAIYAPPGTPIVRAGQSSSRFIGSGANVEVEWQLHPSLSWTFYYSHFFAGPAVTEAGGRDVDFIGSWVTLRF